MCWNAIHHWIKLIGEGVTDVDEQGHEISERSAHDLGGWERDALDALLEGIELFDEPMPGASQYMNGRHRVHAMLQAGVPRTLILRSETTWDE